MWWNKGKDPRGKDVEGFVDTSFFKLIDDPNEEDDIHNDNDDRLTLTYNGPPVVPSLSTESSEQCDTDMKERPQDEETDVTVSDPNDDDDEDRPLRPGDHIYVWDRPASPLASACQRHAIVVSVQSRVGNNDCTSNDDAVVTVVSFYNDREKRQDWKATDAAATAKASAEWKSTRGQWWDDTHNEDESLLLAGSNNCDNRSNGGGRGGEEKYGPSADVASRVREESLESFSRSIFSGSRPKEPQRVCYGSGLARRLLRTAGTTTVVKPDEVVLVVARAKFLLANPGVLPEFHSLSANGECAAMWCVTGRYCTLRGASILELLSAGQAGSAVVAGGIASQIWVLVPAPGLWGAFGWWWYVPATVAYPILIPLLVTYGLASLVPLEILRRYRKRWKSTTEAINRDFWLNADDADTLRTEYFGTTSSSDDDWMRTFFGVREGDDDEDEKGRYMPLNMNENGGDENDDVQQQNLVYLTGDEKDLVGMNESDEVEAVTKFTLDSDGKPTEEQGSCQRWTVMRQWNSWRKSFKDLREPESSRGVLESVPLVTENILI